MPIATAMWSMTGLLASLAYHTACTVWLKNRKNNRKQRCNYCQNFGNYNTKGGNDGEFVCVGLGENADYGLQSRS